MSEIINGEIIFNEWRSNWKTQKEIKKSGDYVEHLLDMLFAANDDTQQFEQFMEMKGMSVEKCIVKECLEYKDGQLICCVKECESVSSNIQQLCYKHLEKHLELSKEIKCEVYDDFPGDSLPYPKTTKEKLDIELDNICSANKWARLNVFFSKNGYTDKEIDMYFEVPEDTENEEEDYTSGWEDYETANIYS